MGALSAVTNAMRRMDNMFPGFFQTSTKRNHYADFGYPENILFSQFWSMYSRNGVAAAAVNKTILKTWLTNPQIQEDGNADDVTATEQVVIDRFAKLRFWQKIAEADRRSLVGRYGGIIFRFADNKEMNEPVDHVQGGLDGLVEVIPVWESQLEVSEWESDSNNDNYGQPKMFSFSEAKIGGGGTVQRSFDVHPDRVCVWSSDGSTFGQSMLSAGYNDLVTIEKVVGAGGEGFWKNAKSAPILTVDKDAQLDQMARSMGVKPDELADKMDEQVEDFQKGFDSLLMLQGMEAKTLGVTLPMPGEFVNVALQSFSSSIGMPLKILVGSQTGERASTEDAKEWSQTIMSRRSNSTIPNIFDIIDRLVSFGVLADVNWSLSWADLTESTMGEKIDRADKMAGVNVKQTKSGGMDVIFTDEEIRETVGFAPLADDEKSSPESGEYE